jgi:peptide deformylase
MIVTDIAELKLSNEDAALGEADWIIGLLESELRSSARPGVGLAAPQIGIHKRVAIVRTKDHAIDLVNPVIVDLDHGMAVESEGCLSFPGVSVGTWRFDEVFVKCDRNPAGMVATGLEAIVLQHEIDHLSGVLITDRAKMRSAGRNDPCPCGSKRKFKRCHGR